ncbi:TPA: radical SAM protein [Candidatus Woesearchaeota archaeon]|nr:hypothetical protein [uncultured archaeon]MBS3173289.1 radical SAM protein [Candidatus Woesearchaeota archaeon]HIH31794.1 radical SAM protein [Candidatus Woesearchaeota archaeon]HIH55326.1 radical SAM protein [Candidatus Woesearchaeota archaeon]HIJ01867.1 radical SAM protein [Candidatus Woesearchaeota archaeon]
MNNKSGNNLNFKLPYYVNWETTNRCNMGCGFCFLGQNPKGSINELNTSNAKKLIQKLAENNVKILNFAGGDPLLRNDIVDLIKYAKNLGLKTILSTNGILLSENIIFELKPYLDYISLPLDGPDALIHDSVRGRKGHFNIILDLINIIRKTNINIKINTMLCKKNIHYVKQVAELLDRYNIKKWKLFQFSARGKAQTVKEHYEISDKEFLTSAYAVGNHNYDIILSSNDLRDNAYFLIGADANVSIPVDDKYIFIGNLISDNIGRFHNNKMLNNSKNIKNAYASYGLADND